MELIRCKYCAGVFNAAEAVEGNFCCQRHADLSDGLCPNCREELEKDTCPVCCERFVWIEEVEKRFREVYMGEDES